jgi:hypothetical protein
MEKASNHKLMSVFGFTVLGNPNDTVRFLPPAVLPGGGIWKVRIPVLITPYQLYM